MSKTNRSGKSSLLTQKQLEYFCLLFDGDGNHLLTLFLVGVVGTYR